MTIQNLEPILREHPFLKDFEERHIQTIVGCARNRLFEAGDYLCREGDRADDFFLIREGRVALELHSPQGGGLRVETLQEGDFLGWSWLVEPYVWHFDARALTRIRTIALDGKCLRTKCESDHDLGYRLLRRFARLIEQRLSATRLQLLDVYADKGARPVHDHR